jgi:hypothetical protein
LLISFSNPVGPSFVTLYMRKRTTNAEHQLATQSAAVHGRSIGPSRRWRMKARERGGTPHHTTPHVEAIAETCVCARLVVPGLTKPTRVCCWPAASSAEAERGSLGCCSFAPSQAEEGEGRCPVPSVSRHAPVRAPGPPHRPQLRPSPA